MQSLELSGEGEESAATAEDFKQPISGLTTVVLPPARVGTVSDDEGSTIAGGGRRPSKRVRVADDD